MRGVTSRLVLRGSGVTDAGMQAQRAVVTPLGRAHYDDSFQACNRRS